MTPINTGNVIELLDPDCIEDCSPWLTKPLPISYPFGQLVLLMVDHCTLVMLVVHPRHAGGTPSSCWWYTLVMLVVHLRHAGGTPSSCWWYTLVMLGVHPRHAGGTPSSCWWYTLGSSIPTNTFSYTAEPTTRLQIFEGISTF